MELGEGLVECTLSATGEASNLTWRPVERFGRYGSAGNGGYTNYSSYSPFSTPKQPLRMMQEVTSH